MKLEIVHVDTCLPDYWRGHHKAHLSIPVYHGMKLHEVKRALKSELSLGCVCGSDDVAFLLSSDYVGDREKDAIEATKAAYAAINRMKLADKRKRKLFTDLDKCPLDDDCDTVYAFFVFTEI